MSTQHTFGKNERLKSSLAIQNLLKNGKTMSIFPLKIYWDLSTDPHQKYPARMAVSVPRRKIRKAVDRNRMKRLLRESYRQNKNIIYEPLCEKGLAIALVILFLQDELLSFDLLNPVMRQLLHKLAAKLN